MSPARRLFPFLPTLLLVLAAGACNRLEVVDPGDGAADAARSVDARVAEDLASGRTAEARSWLGRHGNRLFSGDPDTVQQLIDGLYEDGARRVWFTGIERFGGATVAGGLAAELPEDPVARSAMLRRQASFRERLDPMPDSGQRYLSFRL